MIDGKDSTVKSTLTIALVIAAASLARAVTVDDVNVTGAVAADNRSEFEWVIENRSGDTITKVRVHHFQGAVVGAPTGWHESAMTGNTSRGDALAPGILEFEADSRMQGILPGQTQRFRLRLNQQWGRAIKLRPVLLGFDKGGDLEIRNVPAPAESSFLEHNYPAVGLGAMFAVFLLYKIVRGLGATKPAPTQDDA